MSKGSLSGKIKDNLVLVKVYLILYVLVVIFGVAPISIAYKDALLGRDQFFTLVIEYMQKFYELKFFEAFSPTYFFTFLKVLFIVTIFYTIIFLIGMSKRKNSSGYEKIEHGSSDWCKDGEQYRILSPKEGIILAENNYLPVNKRGNINVMVVGGSGSGKSASYSIPNAHQMLGSYIFTDPKGELYDTTAGFLKANGYNIKVLNLVHPQFSDGYNPLMHISSEIDVDVIASTIVKGQTSVGKSDPYWDDMAEMLLKSLIYYLIATRPDEEQNLASCSELVRAANANNGGNLLTELMSQLPYDHPARMYYKSIEIAPEKTYSGILSSLQSKLGKFDSKEIAELTSTDTIDFDEIAKSKTAVYVISSDTHTAYDFLLTIFFSQMIQQLYDYADNNGGALPVPTYFILDEFANIGRIPDFDKKISTSRSRKISFSVILQNLDQLEAVYKESYETIIGNCDTHIFLGSNSQKTVEYFSKTLGEKTIERKTVSVNKEKGGKKAKSFSDQSMARALMTPDELRRLDNDICIIFEKGLKPIKARKLYYFEKPMSKEMKQLAISHNDIGDIHRGKWRKYNPYNPYVEENNEAEVNDLKVESLDELFDDIDEEKEENKKLKKEENKSVIDSKEKLKTKDLNENINDDIDIVDAFDFDDLLEDDDIQQEKNNQSSINLEEELENKFDELFGSLEEDDDTNK